MRTLSNNILPILLALSTAAGCAADAAGPDDDIDNPGDPSDPDSIPKSPEGRFAMTSDFDVATNLPGTAGTVVNYFISATDEPDDPTKFIVEQVVNALPNGQIKNTLQGSIPFVSGYLNDRLLQVAPNFVDNIVDLGNGFGQVAKHFGTSEILEVTAQGVGTKTVNGLVFNIDGTEHKFLFADYGNPDVKVENVGVTLDQTGKITINPHVVPLKYGAVLEIAMDNVIIPNVDPSVQNLEGLLKKWVNCMAVGQYIYEAIDMGSASTFQSACTAGLTMASSAFYNALNNLDVNALQFEITGTARGIDKTHDGKIDDIQTGTWTGSLSYSGAPAPLGTARFYGTKM
jgi:hypothetical protein